MAGKSADVRSQETANRRGLVLGLTMAEIMVLVLFALLLALGGTLTDQKRRLEQLASLEPFRNQVPQIQALAAQGTTIDDVVQRIERQRQQIEQQEAEVRRLTPFEQQAANTQELLKQFAQGVVVEDVIQRIERQREEVQTLTAQVDRLAQYEATADLIDDVLQQLGQGDGPATPQKVVETLNAVQQLGTQNDALRGQVVHQQGQIAQLGTQIKAQGTGNALPSCWVTPDGETESIFDVTYRPEGIEVRDRVVERLPHRIGDRAALDERLRSVSFGTPIDIRTFRSQLSALYVWSTQQVPECRFYVVLLACGAPAQWNDQVNAVAAYFFQGSRTIQTRQC